MFANELSIDIFYQWTVHWPVFASELPVEFSSVNRPFPLFSSELSFDRLC